MNDISKLGLGKALDLKGSTNTKNSSETSFENILDNSLKELNETQVKADKAIADLATGEVKDLHQAAIAISKAETSMKLMLEIRNKAINAYKEITRTQI